MARNEPASFRLTLRPLPDEHGRTPTYRLKKLLKYALRYCRLRCVDMAEVGKDAPAVVKSS